MPGRHSARAAWLRSGRRVRSGAAASRPRWLGLAAEWLRPVYEQLRTGVMAGGYGCGVYKKHAHATPAHTTAASCSTQFDAVGQHPKGFRAELELHRAGLHALRPAEAALLQAL